MGLIEKFKAGLQQTHSRLTDEFRRIASGSPKATQEIIESLETALIRSDFGLSVTEQVISAVRRAYETQGSEGVDIIAVAAQELERTLSIVPLQLRKVENGPTVISLVGVNGTGKTTTAAKLAFWLRQNKFKPMLAACDTFRAAAIDQLKSWGQRLDVPVIAGAYGADPAAVAHDACTAALSREIDYLLVDTAGRLHTKSNLMQELQKLGRVLDKKLPGAPHETLLVLDATTGMNALNQAREFHKAVPLTGFVVTKLDGTSKGGMVVAIQKELNIPVKFIGLGEQPGDLQAFEVKSFVSALFWD
jgi:fused signal recognition particle receptor